jgi:hypothetical protein
MISNENAMSMTLNLVTETLPMVYSGGTEERWDGCVELSNKAKELSVKDLVDHELLREIAYTNAGNRMFDADDVLMNKGPEADALWQGTGTSITTKGDKVVHYINIPGKAEQKYGPGFPYIMTKLGWAAVLASQDFEAIDNTGGYPELTKQLRAHGLLQPNVLPHLGASIAPATRSSELLIASASGVLPTPLLHQAFADAGYRSREQADEHLLDGFPDNLRAGLYDAVYGRMVLQAMRGEGPKLAIPDSSLYIGVDIN